MNIRFVYQMVIVTTALAGNLIAMEREQLSKSHWEPGQKPVSTHVKLRRVLSAPLPFNKKQKITDTKTKSEKTRRRQEPTDNQEFANLYSLLELYGPEHDQSICQKMEPFLSDTTVNLKTAILRTLLFPAIIKGHLQVVQLLLNKNADPNITDAKKTTPLYHAFFNKHIEIAQLLLENRAQLTTINQIHVINVLNDKYGKESAIYIKALSYLDKEFNNLMEATWPKDTQLKTMVNLFNNLSIETKENYFNILQEWLLRKWVAWLLCAFTEPRHVPMKEESKDAPIKGKSRWGNFLKKVHIHSGHHEITPVFFPTTLSGKVNYISKNNQNPAYNIVSIIATFLVLDTLKLINRDMDK